MYSEIAIIGMSGKFPEAKTLTEFHNNLLSGKDCVRKMSKERAKLLRIADYENMIELAYLDDIDCFDNKFFNISNREAKYMSPEKRISLEMAALSILDAGYSLKQFRKMNCSVLVSSSKEKYKDFIQNKDALSFVGNLHSMTSGNIAYYLDLRGPNYMIDTGCSSNIVAINEAAMQLITNQVDVALVGGVSLELLTNEQDLEEIKAVGVVSSTGRCKSFDAEADGLAMGEGCGFVVLKRLDDAKQDNDHIYGVIKCCAINSNGSRSDSPTKPNIDGQVEVMLTAWKKGKIRAEDITEFEAHATGTVIGDPIEVTSISKALMNGIEKAPEQSIEIGAVKSSIGHLVEASGMASIIKVLLEFDHDVIYPVVHFTKLNPNIDFSMANLKPVKAAIYLDGEKRRCVGINSFGFSGTNGHIVIENYKKENDGNIEIAEKNRFVKISAKTEDSLEKYSKALVDYLKNINVNINNAIYTLNIGRDDYLFRKMLYVSNKEELINKLSNSISYSNKVLPKIFFVMAEDLDDEGKEHQIVMEKYLRALNILPTEVHTSSEMQKDMENYLYDEKVIFVNFGQHSILLGKLYEKWNEYMVNVSESFEKLIVDFYNSGYDINWNSYYADCRYQRVSLPGYIFDIRRQWVTPETSINFKKTELVERNEDTSYLSMMKTASVLDMDVDSNAHTVSNERKDQLKKIWQEVLEIDEDFGFDETFFDLGGNSMLANMMIENINKTFNCDIAIYEIYEYETIEQLEGFIQLKLEEQSNAITEEDKEKISETVPLYDDSSDIKKIIEIIWKEVLETDEDIDYNDSFIELGGNSLLANMMTEKVNEKLNSDIAVYEIYEYETIMDLARYINEKRESKEEM